MTPDDYADRLDRYLDYVGTAPTADGSPVRLPGERSDAARAASGEQVDLDADQWADLVAQLEAAGIPVP
jgi:LDH2 family malate/lactate/ureidoglycolate dehydrogenase